MCLGHETESRIQSIIYVAMFSFDIAQGAPRNSTAVFCAVTDSFPGSSLAAATACCSDGINVKWDTCIKDSLNKS
jgi:hypothetical protein